MKILLTTDGSSHSEFAERLTSDLMCCRDSSVDLEIVAVCPSPNLHLLGAEFPATVHEAVDECRGRTQEALDAVASRLRGRVKTCQLSLLDGHPAHEILQRIEETQPDLCVVGSHGWTFSERVFLGSVSSQIAKHAACSILVAKPHQNVLEPATCQTILVAEDGTGSAVRGLSRLRPHCDHQNIKLRFISVTHEDYSVEPLVPEQFAEVQLRKVEERRSHLSELASDERPHWKDIDTQVRSGTSITREIIESARECKADLILMSSESKSLLKRIFLGSNALSILHHAPCSIWIDRGDMRNSDTL